MKKAFTLIELLVVIAIIGILSMIILANLLAARQQARDAKRVADVNSFQLAVQLYFDKCNRYPTNSGNVPDLASSAGCPAGITLANFISVIPTPPVGTADTTYRYIVKSDGSDFYVGSYLEIAVNQQLKDDIDGTVGAAGTWLGYNGGTFDANDPDYVVSSK